jgi:hypothetical protein
MWDLNDLNAPESEAVQSEREIVEDIVRNEPTHYTIPAQAIIEAAEPDTGLVHFKRLRNNAWGIIGPSALLREGVDVAVTKRDGTATMATVSRVIWSGDGKAICSIRRA